MGWKAAHSLNDWVTPCVPLKLHDWAEVQFMRMPQGARHGKTCAKLRTACLWHPQGVPPFQRNCVGTGILKSELRYQEDRWLCNGSNDFFVPDQDLCQKCFVFLFPLAKSFPFRLLASFPHPMRTAQQKKKGGQTVSLQNLKLINSPSLQEEEEQFTENTQVFASVSLLFCTPCHLPSKHTNLVRRQEGRGSFWNRIVQRGLCFTALDYRKGKVLTPSLQPQNRKFAPYATHLPQSAQGGECPTHLEESAEFSWWSHGC